MIDVNGQLSHVDNPAFNPAGDYPSSLKAIFSHRSASPVIEAIKQWPDYQATPLLSLQALAADLGINKLWYKDESQRFNLKSFKALGGAFAVSRQISQRIEAVTGHYPDITELLSGEHADIVKDIVISCATDGNHGRSVAWGCQMFGCPCIIYIHRDVSKGREQAMQSFGAEVIRISGNYDESVKLADQEAQKHGRIIVSDTSYPGYMEIPKDVALGYSVFLSESVTQMQGEIPTHVFVQGGVGGLASAVCAYFWECWGDSRPRFILVEPEQANCLQQSARQGKPTVVDGDLDTLMAGLACGEVSLLAWDILTQGCNDFMTVNEASVATTMQLLARPLPGDAAVEAGESAVAGLAALITACHDDAMKSALGLDEHSRVYIIGTEGATDPEVYERLVNP